jgi:excisionase family DNA binding protein
METIGKLAVDLQEAASITSLSVHTLRLYVKEGKLKATRCGTRIVIPVKNLEELVNGGCPSRSKQ